MSPKGKTFSEDPLFGLNPQGFKYVSNLRSSNQALYDLLLRRKLGEGGCGGVLEGRLDDGRPVAVKGLKRVRGSGKEFFNKVVGIGCTYHVNIVGLLDFCLEGSRRVLVNEFMPNGSLEKFIHNRNKNTSATTMMFDCAKLLDIVTGMLGGLEYLHHGCNIGILHFDIKPHNVLLDGDYSPKNSDFGLAKICRSAEGGVSMLGARGTAGYIAPEVFSRSYGAVSSPTSTATEWWCWRWSGVGGTSKRTSRTRASSTSRIGYTYKKSCDENIQKYAIERNQRILPTIPSREPWILKINL
uniref:Protein kinase domain-containing protein n=1 Tax=Ananas comosus var. bracteatus TaxID=296719 RepID=A0A6V7NPJ7_ANACO|nr:unnamed protein product [Ananas comosus var. bracteatus]